MQRTDIEYLTHTWNPIAMRCTKVSPGCDNCWHLRMAHRMASNKTLPLWRRKIMAGTDGPKLDLIELDEPLKNSRDIWQRIIGVQFMGDLFHESVTHEQIVRVIEVIEKGSWRTFMILTKRPEKMLDFFAGSSGAGLQAPPMRNLWLGVTTENQEQADNRIPVLLQTPAAHRFVSIEPCLGEVDLTNIQVPPDYHQPPASLNLVILGGETGPHARPMNPLWVRKVRDDCAAAGVPFFFKGWGKHNPFRPDLTVVGKRELDGREHNELPWRTDHA